VDRLSQTARIVAASLKNNPHTPASDLPDLIRTIHAALPVVGTVTVQPMVPADAIEPESQQEAQQEQIEEQAGSDAPRGRMSIHEALAASRARFGGSDGEDEQSMAEAEAEVEAHAS
jgi:hypothetical protein